MTHQENFRNWFADHIRALAPDRNAGFILALVSFPLLERYLRQKTKAEPKHPRFIAGLLEILPELQTPAIAQTFWTTYRHGLLHNVAMSRETHGLTHDSRIVEIESTGKVWLNPVLFASRVLEAIETDFHTFESGHDLPTVNIYGRVPEQPSAPNYYLGTGSPPRKV